MKRQAIGTLIKDVIIAVVAYALIAFLLNATKIDIFYGSPMNQMFAGDPGTSDADGARLP